MSKSAKIIQLSAFRQKAGASPMARRVAVAPADETETCKNFRLRQQRRDDWRRADALRNYWEAARKMDSAIWRVQQHELPEGDLHQPHAPGSCWPIIAKNRAAIMAQLLTPAPTMREVEWKRAVFKGGDHEHTDIKLERIERAIADDVEFLRTHPTRRSGKQGMDPKKLEERRAWKAAFRARVAAFAEKRGIPKSELAWLGRIKHQDIAAVAEQHRISYGLKLEGRGSTFRTDPSTIDANMKGAEFAMVVRTLPTAEQRLIEAKLRELARKGP